jgi:hypothetical protein
VTSPGLGITRRRVLLRARFGWPRRTVPFNQDDLHQPDGYRQNAPGFVSMCYNIPISARNWGGANIVTLLTDGWMREIDPSEVLPGDAIGELGPNGVEPDGGVILIFDSWLDLGSRMAFAWTHLPIVGLGPDLRGRAIDYKWHYYRYTHLLPDPPLPAVLEGGKRDGPGEIDP